MTHVPVPAPPRQRYRLELVGSPGEVPEIELARLRAALKSLKRRFRFRCTRLEEVRPE